MRRKLGLKLAWRHDAHPLPVGEPNTTHSSISLPFQAYAEYTDLQSNGGQGWVQQCLIRKKICSGAEPVGDGQPQAQGRVPPRARQARRATEAALHW